MAMVTLTINGTTHTVDVPSDMPLLWVLRDVVGLTGTKFGCGIAACGACTVQLDGQPIRSCVTPVAAVAGKKITTIEAIGETPPAFAPNAFIRIGTDGRITLIMNQVEMGQGMYTSMPMLLAEGLEVGLDQVQLEHAPPNDKLYANPLVGFQMTGASSSVRMLYTPLRTAGATARTMLVAAAARTCEVDPRSCRARRGVVTHATTGRTLTYGALAEQAAKLPVPEKVALKDPKDFTLIGTPAKRLDTPDKVKIGRAHV